MSLSIVASSSRVGTEKINATGIAARTPVPASAIAIRLRVVTATNATPAIAIQALSRVSESSRIASVHGTSQRQPRRSARIAQASAVARSASPQLSVCGKPAFSASDGSSGRRERDDARDRQAEPQQQEPEDGQD